MKKTFFLLLSLSIALFAVAQPANYYNSANGLSGNQLKMALHNIIKGHTVVSYSNLNTAYAYTDCKPNGKIWDMYSNYEFNLSKTCGQYDKEGDCWNKEHSWPQSWFNGKAGPKSDLFHVIPTDGYVNNRRSNYPYGEVSHPTYTSGNGSKLGPCVTAGYSGTVFEPIDEYKGDLARGYFYVSVRYYSEDSGWSTSAMTNKSVILPWAMDMLLRWSDQDPVSQKEIDRNNAIYGFQGNRNPFIDHPEYAHMIWDPNWTQGTSYPITCATGLQHGSISAPASALEGSTVAITAIPDAGYMVDSYSVYKTGSPSATVAVSSNGTFTMPDYGVTVSASFKVNNTLYGISLAQVSHGSISTSASSALSGTSITLTATPDEGYALYSWYVYKTGDMSSQITVTDNSFVMPSFDVTVNASFTDQIGLGNYVKVTQAPESWSGEYLIVYEEGNVAFNGGLEELDAAGNTISVTISDNTIEASEATDAAKFTIAPMDGGYSIQSASGIYIGLNGNSNGLNGSSNPQANTISYSGVANIVSSGGAYLRFNASSGQNRFRYYKSASYSSQKAIQLYKKVGSSNVPTHSIHFNSNGGEGSMNDQNVPEFVPTALTSNTFTREGFMFDGWNTEANGEGTYYADGAMITITEDLELFAQWEPLYSITCLSPEHGSISVDPVIAAEDDFISLTATPDSGYELDAWIVTDALGNPVIVNDNLFEMPACNVTVTASFVFVGATYEQKYYLVTSADQLVAGRTYLIVNTSYGKALGKTQNSNNRSAAAVVIQSNAIATLGDACELTLGGTTGAWTFYDSVYNNHAGGYLSAVKGSNNCLRTLASLNDAGRWTITLDANGSTIIKTISSDVERNTIKYNNSNTIFSCYASGQQEVCLFIRSEQYNITENTTLARVFPFDKCTVSGGAILTVTGSLESTNPGLLILDDGAQLIHTNDGVQATFKKSITAYTEEGGWFTIATPFTSYDPEGTLTEAPFDLYSYDEDGEMEWSNYKAEAFNLMPGAGYLYAHQPTTTLRMTGTLNNGDYTETIPLNYGNSHESVKGFNLLGNPTAHSITFTKTAGVSDGYYYLENSGTWVYSSSNIVPAGRGFLVKANTEGQTVTLNPQSKQGEGDSQSTAFLQINVDEEKAFIKMTEGISMPLLSFQGKHSGLYLSRDGKPYVMLVKDEADSIQLNYKPQEDGTHTLTISAPFTSHLSSFTLIDNLTGTEINLLETPSYRFESRVTDDEARFQLIIK